MRDKLNINESCLLLIFYRNPALGKVKTRLAAGIGDEAALAVYYRLASHTREVANALALDCRVCYTDFIDREDAWPNSRFQKKLQQGADLGERMANSFREAFTDGYRHVVIIGTDCPGLTMHIVQTAFDRLAGCDLVVGPAADGGYYLLGMTQEYPQLFQGKTWGTSSVLRETLEQAAQLRLRVSQLAELNDVDVADDLPAHWRLP
ncbi:MAG: TIGR04282 family arsenosugar biosynthesis glycosyltransferase [Cyclobacteriaceae bacterium]|jgi:rSAM/selenodomain-associated transferase 1